MDFDYGRWENEFTRSSFARFVGDIYGRRIAVEFFQKLRPERKFANIEQLKNQIAKDVEQCRSLTLLG